MSRPPLGPTQHYTEWVLGGLCAWGYSGHCVNLTSHLTISKLSMRGVMPSATHTSGLQRDNTVCTTNITGHILRNWESYALWAGWESVPAKYDICGGNTYFISMFVFIGFIGRYLTNLCISIKWISEPTTKRVTFYSPEEQALREMSRPSVKSVYKHKIS
jgi:hypothetical protein